MKAINPLAARTLTVVGLVLILAVLLDYIVLLVPPDFGNRQWQLNLMTQFVDRGIVPLVGLAFLLTGCWLSDQEGGLGPVLRTARLGALGLASLLGLVFLLIVPLHVNNAHLEQADAIKRITEQATQADKSLGNVVATQVEQERGRIQALLQNEKVLTQAIAQGAIKGEQVALLQKFKDNPKAVDTYLSEISKKEEERLRKEIIDRRKKAEGDANGTAMKAGIRTGLSSALLAVGYALVGWTGLRESR
jgi:hypothetical protein